MRIVHALILLSVLGRAEGATPPLCAPNCGFTKFSVGPTGRIIDNNGRERYFHGVNMVEKQFPWYPNLTMNEIVTLSELGVNVIRLGVMWAGAEANQGDINMTYISQLVNIVNNAGNYGIFTLLDAHQDVYNARLCGEGFPGWAVTASGAAPFPIPVQETPFNTTGGLPSWEDCSKHPWASYYFAQETGEAFQALYSNTFGLADSFAAFWGAVAKAFLNNPFVLGVELVNEPFAGDVFKHPNLLVPEQADRVNLQPFYDRLSSVIRSIDPDRMVFFESVTWADELNIKFIRSGFSHTPGDGLFNNKSTSSYHYYDAVNLGPLGEYLNNRQQDATRLDCGIMNTEFDIRDPSKNKAKIIQSMEAMEKRFHSWIGWDWLALFNAETGMLNPDGALVLSRPFAQIVQGSVVSSSFNTTSSIYQLTYRIDGSVIGVSQISAPATWYPKGFQVSASPSSAVIITVGDYAVVLASNTTVTTEVQVVISPKQA